MKKVTGFSLLGACYKEGIIWIDASPPRPETGTGSGAATWWSRYTDIQCQVWARGSPLRFDRQ